jgi:hypothetical protein
MTRTALTLAITAAAFLPNAALAQGVQSHLHCFAVKDSAPRARYQLTVTTDAGTQTCTVRTPAKVACVPSAVSGVTPAPPGGGPAGSGAGSFLCYLAKCAPAGLSTNAEDAFGRRLVRFRASRFVCAPADLNAPPPGVTTTTTTLVGGDACRFQDGECRGTCGAGARCGAAVGTGSCECRTVACGDADAPECNGACSSPGEACIFDLSGCSCVDIP